MDIYHIDGNSDGLGQNHFATGRFDCTHNSYLMTGQIELHLSLSCHRIAPFPQPDGASSYAFSRGSSITHALRDGATEITRLQTKL